MNRANESQVVSDPELRDMEIEIAGAVEVILTALRINWRDDPNSRDTPSRVAKMYVREVFAGRFTARPTVTTFPSEGIDQLYVVGPIRVQSCCSHHLCPVFGDVWVGILPGDLLAGLSKFARLARWIFERPQMQEAATQQLADELFDLLSPRGVAVVVRATHTCMTWRGVRDGGSTMITSEMRGVFREDDKARAEVMALMRGQGL
jgi:GTP cyclohydrolase I